MKMSRAWAMPSKATFTIKPIAQLIRKYIRPGERWLDPFARKSAFASLCITNDLNPAMPTDYHEDALAFLRRFKSVPGILFDPPYSPRQLAECYKGIGVPVTGETTQSAFWANVKVAIARATRPGGHCISCGWNSGGIGKQLGFKIVEILLVAHGGWHNDTIITVDRKVQHALF